MQSQTSMNIQSRINNIFSQLYDIEYTNVRRLFQNEPENICYDINSGQIRFGTLNKFNQKTESQQLRTIIDSLQTQIEQVTTQNMNFQSEYQQSIDIGDENTYRTLQQNLILRQSFIKVLGSMYKQTDYSKLTIRNLINKVRSSFQKNLESDQTGIKLVTSSIGVQTFKISQIQYQKFVMADQDGDEIQDLSTFSINRIVQMSRYLDNFYFSQQSFQDQFKNGTYIISEIENNSSYKSKSIIPLQSQVVNDPFIYVDRDTTTIQVKKIYSGKLNFNMKYELDRCNQSRANNPSIHKYSLICSNHDEKWIFDQCQLDQQINKKGKIIFFCVCKMINPITLMILNETNLNKTNTRQINTNIDIEDYIQISLRYNTYNLIILAILITLLIMTTVQSYIYKIPLTSNIMYEHERVTSEQTLTLTQQPQFSQALFKRNLKYLHEISRLVTIRLTYLSQQARILLIIFNTSIPLTTLNVFVTILGNYFISFSLSLLIELTFQILTKIIEGFFTGPQILKVFGYIIIIILNLGLFILNSFINRFNHYLIYDIVQVVILITLYGPLEILIQYNRLRNGFQKYKELKLEPMNPILNFIYYFLQG